MQTEIANMNAQGLVPIGGVIPYFGRLEDLDEKMWQLCDGSLIVTGPLNGRKTPLLQDKFIRGTTDSANVGQGDGDDWHQHPDAQPIGGTFTGNGIGNTIRQQARKFPWGDNLEVHPMGEGDNCATYEWDVKVNVQGTVQTNSHNHGGARNVPLCLKAFHIMRIG